MTFVLSLSYSYDNHREMRQEELGAGEGAGSGGPAKAQGLQWAARQLLAPSPHFHGPLGEAGQGLGPLLSTGLTCVWACVCVFPL